MSTAPDYKKAAVEQWSADPCEEHNAVGEPGTREYFLDLLRARDDYAAWMPDVIDYAGTRGLDVLDVGCGQGLDVARYAMAGARATGIDLTPRHVELARLHIAAMGLNATIVSGDAEALPFDDESYDRVSSNGVLHHTPDIQTALREVYRVLRPGGEARIILYNKSSLHYWLDQVLWCGVLRGQIITERSMAGVLSRNVEYSSVDARPLVRVYTPGQVRALLSAAGFAAPRTVVRQFQLGDAFPAAAMARLVPPLRTQAGLDSVGRRAGWYVTGIARKV